MTFSQELIDKVQDKKFEILKEAGRNGIGVRLGNTLKGVCVFQNNWEVCRLEDITQMIEELTWLKQILREEFGIEF